MAEITARVIPSVDFLLNTPKGRELSGSYGREASLRACREVLEGLRAALQGEQAPLPSPDSLLPEAILEQIAARLRLKSVPRLVRAINATGILMHSGLGRAVLSPAAGQALAEVAKGYSTLALDLETGRRGQRDAHVGGLLCELTGAEAATVVNNNAAATVLILNTLAAGKEVIVSRGQLVEIGGSFRLPEVMKTSGAILREVGTTNKTHLRDYEQAVTQETGAILRVHHSNYRILGFAEEPEIEPLAELGRTRGIPVIDDLGSGALVDLKAYGLETEPLVQRSIQAGVTCACFSGDKLIGGPQSGIIVGTAECLQRIRKNPLVRAFRCGKLTLAALEATLRLFLIPERLNERHPVYQMLSRTPVEIKKRARRVANGLKRRLPPDVKIAIIDGESQVGSGSVPVETIPTKLLSLSPSSVGPDELTKKLRLQTPPVFTRIAKGAVLFDFRTIQPEEDNLVLQAIVQLW